jgi:5'-methylthioadenosine phosphorylase
MTQYPEAYLVEELEMDPLNISLITDYDTGVDDVPPVSHAEVIEVFTENNVKLRKLLFKLIELIPASTTTGSPDHEFSNVLVSARHG